MTTPSSQSNAGVGRVYEDAVSVLSAAGVPNPTVDAELLLGHVLEISRGHVQARVITNHPITNRDRDALTTLIERRAQREPLQHITGRAPFRSLELAVGPGVFVPRPETEQVTQLAIDALNNVSDTSPCAVDLGTGSGAIALSIAVEVTHAEVFAVENSADAFRWAEQNFRTIAATNAHLIFDDLAHALSTLNGTVSVVISNPPYIPAGATPRDPEVHLFDPTDALYGGEDGLDAVRKVSHTARRLLRPGGTLIIEHGEQQAQSVESLLNHDKWLTVRTHRDLTGRDRATSATL